MKKIAVGFVLVLAVLVLLFFINPQIKPSHNAPLLALAQESQPAAGSGADYLVVSGAANSNKVSGVWHNDKTRFAQSREGFVELAVTVAGVYLQVFTIDSDTPVAGFWLDL